jgi:hypothetical protein
MDTWRRWTIGGVAISIAITAVSLLYLLQTPNSDALLLILPASVWVGVIFASIITKPNHTPPTKTAI